MKPKKRIKAIEKELRELYPKKELAYIDYTDNAGDAETGGRLWCEFTEYRDKWNKLVDERRTLLKK